MNLEILFNTSTSSLVEKAETQYIIHLFKAGPEAILLLTLAAQLATIIYRKTTPTSQYTSTSILLMRIDNADASLCGVYR